MTLGIHIFIAGVYIDRNIKAINIKNNSESMLFSKSCDTDVQTLINCKLQNAVSLDVIHHVQAHTLCTAHLVNVLSNAVR